MPWSAGTFSRTDGTRNGSTVWTQAKSAAVKINAADHDTHDQDLATGINACLAKDGSNSPSDDIDFDSNKITGLAAGSSATDSAALGQSNIAVTTSGTDTYTATLSPAPAAYVSGMTYHVTFANANTSTTPTLNLNSLGAKTIVKEGSGALSAGDIPAGHEAALRYNGTNMVLLNPKTLNGAVLTSRTITGGSGLTGGGDLSGDRTLVVGAGTGISVSDDAVAIDKATTAQMKDPTSSGVNKVVTGDNFQFHPGCAKAWVSFNGSTGAINGGAGVGSYNVSSVTRNAAGDYTINFSTAFATINYAAVATVVAPASNGTIWQAGLKNGSSPSTGSFPLTTQPNNGAYTDATWISVVFFGGQ